MITLTLCFFAYLQEDFGKELTIEVHKPIKLIQLFSLFSSKNRKKANDYFLNNHDLKTDYIILINGRNIEAFDGLHTILDSSCEVSFFPLLGGGVF
ncbi:MAG: MoaD/ThiS family protein [Candidatus Hodarchaeota archaeon]